MLYTLHVSSRRAGNQSGASHWPCAGWGWVCAMQTKTSQALKRMQGHLCFSTTEGRVKRAEKGCGTRSASTAVASSSKHSRGVKHQGQPRAEGDWLHQFPTEQRSLYNKETRKQRSSASSCVWDGCLKSRSRADPAG